MKVTEKFRNLATTTATGPKLYTFRSAMGVKHWWNQDPIGNELKQASLIFKAIGTF